MTENAPEAYASSAPENSSAGDPGDPRLDAPAQLIATTVDPELIDRLMKGQK